jgi:hypothetical protein
MTDSTQDILLITGSVLIFSYPITPLQVFGMIYFLLCTLSVPDSFLHQDTLSPSVASSCSRPQAENRRTLIPRIRPSRVVALS